MMPAFAPQENREEEDRRGRVPGSGPISLWAGLAGMRYHRVDADRAPALPIGLAELQEHLMKRWILLAGAVAGIGGSFLAAIADITPLEMMVATERSFADRSKYYGIRAAFLEFMTENSVVFRPLPTNGRYWALAMQESRDTLAWEPDFARIAQRGDLGVTSGPWEYTAVDSSGATEKAWGHFLSIWELVTDGDRQGQMRVVLDIGVSHPKPAAPPTYDFRADSSAGEPRLLIGAAKKTEEKGVLAAEQKLAKKASGGKFAEALAAQARPDLRLYRPGVAPIVGLAPAREHLAADLSRWKWVPDEVRIAKSGELAYSYGVARAPAKAGTDSTTFVRVWQRDPGSDWRVLIDLQVPVRRRS